MQLQTAVHERPDRVLARRRIRIGAAEIGDPCPDEVLARPTRCGVYSSGRGCIHGLGSFPTLDGLGGESAIAEPILRIA